jgi:hypothetical protein
MTALSKLLDEIVFEPSAKAQGASYAAPIAFTTVVNHRTIRLSWGERELAENSGCSPEEVSAALGGVMSFQVGAAILHAVGLDLSSLLHNESERLDGRGVHRV